MPIFIHIMYRQSFTKFRWDGTKFYRFNMKKHFLPKIAIISIEPHHVLRAKTRSSKCLYYIT